MDEQTEAAFGRYKEVSASMSKAIDELARTVCELRTQHELTTARKAVEDDTWTARCVCGTRKVRAVSPFITDAIGDGLHIDVMFKGKPLRGTDA